MIEKVRVHMPPELNFLESVGVIVVGIIFLLIAEKSGSRKFSAGSIMVILYGIYLLIANIWFAVTTPAPLPTSTPRPHPTSTHVTYFTPTSPAFDCIPWHQVTTKMLGQSACVYGVIHRIQEYPGATQLRFGNQYEFFFASGTYYYPGVGPGNCVYATGEILRSAENVPYINIDNVPLYKCEDWMK